MSYTKLTDFAAKDALLSGNPSKLLRGTEIGAEFDAIESAMAAAEAVNITAPIIAASTSKTTPVDADVLPILDSVASNILKKVTWANVKATLKTYFDTLYAATGSFAASGANNDITSLSALTNGIVGTSGNQTIGGVKTFSSMPVMPVQSMVRLTGSNGYGSTNTAIWRLTTLVVNQGSDIAYADSATLGASFTINTSGVYSATFRMVPSGINGGLGISLNSSQLSTNILSIASADSVSGMQINTANTTATCSWTGYLAAGSVIRPHGDGGAAGNTTAPAFTITRVA